jgi:predicted DsbA family dithiol-disulfide isomerase
MIRSVGLVLLAAAVATASPAPAQTPEPSPSPSDVVATIGGEPFTARQLEEAAGARLFQLRTQQYQAQRQILDDEIARRLLEREAAARKLTSAELLKQEVEAKVAPVTEEEQRAFYAQNKARMGDMTEADALKRIEAGLRQQRVGERQAAFLSDLRAKADVHVMLEPPRLALAIGDDPARGPADAPVTIVEFSDFQCPFCSRATATLKKLDAAYPGKIRLVYRDFPLVQIHPNAARAAEAAACANEQGKFWPMHDVMFEHQDKLGEADLKQSAATLGLDAAAFNTCLESGRHTAEWKKDAAEGDRYGVSSTPAFFINGRLVVGAQPYESFARILDEELARSARGGAGAGKKSP